jgi:hypothetical protein
MTILKLRNAVFTTTKPETTLINVGESASVFVIWVTFPKFGF